MREAPPPVQEAAAHTGGCAPDPHLAFGNGPHRRTGTVLARLRTGLLVDALLDRLPGPRAAVPAEGVEWPAGR